ncbi:MAG TPA: AtpZ/AtpI family protein [Candidatus Acidoferrales bacterium]|nr:AtpZ/AtpI family protein [Candidatus Acidoferrales bacterium]
MLLMCCTARGTIELISDLDGTMPSPSDQARKERAGFARQFAVAMQAPFTLVAFVAVGGAIGYFADRWLHTTPLLMILLLIAGLILGIRDMLKSLTAAEKKDHE